MAHWRCVQQCGACCQLDPSDRPDLADYLSPEELTQYLSMVGPEGWCINYNHDQRTCNIYDQRPRFCRVDAASFEAMYGIDPADLDEFAIDCCQQQIEGVYGNDSPEMERFQTAVEP